MGSWSTVQGYPASEIVKMGWICRPWFLVSLYRPGWPETQIYLSLSVRVKAVVTMTSPQAVDFGNHFACLPEYVGSCSKTWDSELKASIPL